MRRTHIFVIHNETATRLKDIEVRKIEAEYILYFDGLRHVSYLKPCSSRELPATEEERRDFLLNKWSIREAFPERRPQKIEPTEEKQKTAVAV